jgi:hypothetical protein
MAQKVAFSHPSTSNFQYATSISRTFTVPVVVATSGSAPEK